MGEYVAACVAGLFTLEDGLKLISARGELMQKLPRDGAMAAVMADEHRVRAELEGREDLLSVAALNGPQSVVVSGSSTALDDLLAALDSAGIEARRLRVSHAFHSPLMEPILPDFERIAKEVKCSSPWIKMISGVSGNPVTTEITTPEYWCRHIRQPVQFKKSIETLLEQGYEVFIEIGPTPMLLGMAQQILDCRLQIADLKI